MIIKNVQELEKLVKDLLNSGKKKFLLEWDLGVWKTEFTKQLAKQLWIKNISSPTYTYINTYDNKLLHWDFYRINSEEEFLNLGIADEIIDYDYVCIEWPKFENYYDNWDFTRIKIEKLPDWKRKIEIL